ncbi:hypothetical protein Droror1_Dr00007418 [Drosera rotundifolia]
MKASESIPLHSRFLETVYKSPIQFVNLQGQKDKVADEINAWVDNTTRGLIQEIATPESIETEENIVLANALYFKARWYELFGKAGPKDFHLLNGQTVSVPFMTLN